MPQIDNDGFEEIGVHAGLAKRWSVYGRRGGPWTPAAYGGAPRTAVLSPNSYSSNWTLGNVTVSSASIAAPDNTLADRIVETAANDIHIISSPSTVFSAGTHVIEAYFKRTATRRYISLGAEMGVVAGLYDLLEQRVLATTAPAGNITAVNAGLVVAANGWMKLRLMFTCTATVTAIDILIFLTPSTFSYAGSTSEHVGLWGVSVQSGRPLGYEVFASGWSSSEAYAAHATTTPAFYELEDAEDTPIDREQFESGWNNDPFPPHMLTATPLYDAASNTEPFEDFEDDWVSPAGSQAVFPHITSFESASYVGAGFFEPFSLNWNGSSDYSATIVAGADATYGASLGTALFEDFESSIADKLITADPANDRFVCTTHGLFDGFLVNVYASLGGKLPDGFSAVVDYYVFNSTPNTFQLAHTLGGPAHPVSDVGVGDLFVRTDPSRFWNGASFNTTL